MMENEKGPFVSNAPSPDDVAKHVLDCGGVVVKRMHPEEIAFVWVMRQRYKQRYYPVELNYTDAWESEATTNSTIRETQTRGIRWSRPVKGPP